MDDPVRVKITLNGYDGSGSRWANLDPLPCNAIES